MDISLYSTLNISKTKYAEIIHGGMLKNKFLVQEWSCGGLSDKEGFYDNDRHQDKDWVPKKITNDTALINIWQPQEQKNALFGPEMSETHLLHPLHFSWEQSLPRVSRMGITRYYFRWW